MMATASRRWFKVWSLPGCVSENPTFGGIAFPRKTRVPISEVDGKTDWSSRQGDYVQLTEDQVQKIHAAIRREVQRVFDHKSGRGKIYVKESPNYIPYDEDKPMSEFVRMVEVAGPPEVYSTDDGRIDDVPDEAKELLDDPEVRLAVRTNTRRKQNRMRVDDTPIDVPTPGDESRQGQTDKSTAP